MAWRGDGDDVVTCTLGKGLGRCLRYRVLCGISRALEIAIRTGMCITTLGDEEIRLRMLDSNSLRSVVEIWLCMASASNDTVPTAMRDYTFEAKAKRNARRKSKRNSQ